MASQMMNSERTSATTSQVAELFAVSAQSVRRWARSGRVPAYRAGGQFRFDLNEVEDALRLPAADDDDE